MGVGVIFVEYCLNLYKLGLGNIYHMYRYKGKIQYSTLSVILDITVAGFKGCMMVKLCNFLRKFSTCSDICIYLLQSLNPHLCCLFIIVLISMVIPSMEFGCSIHITA